MDRAELIELLVSPGWYRALSYVCRVAARAARGLQARFESRMTKPVVAIAGRASPSAFARRSQACGMLGG